MNTRLAWALPLCLLAGCGSPPPPMPQSSVLIDSELPRQTTMTHNVQAYGTAIASVGGSFTISRAVDGLVTRVMVAAGQRVGKGQPLLEFQLSSSTASALTQAGSALAAAREEQARIDRLLADNLATRDQKNQADKAASDAAAALHAASADAGGRSVTQAIAAPFDGVVETVSVARGDRVAAGAALMALTQRQGLAVACGVEPADATRVVAGQNVVLTPLAGGRPMHGSVTRIGQVLNDRTRLIDVEVGVDGEPIRGMAYRADIGAGTVSGWSVPAAAVLDDAQGTYLFQVKGMTARRVAVSRLGPAQALHVLVDGKLDGKQAVVSAGAYQLSDGAQVRPSPRPAQAPPGGSGR
ncbi:efflux RND transporter periplasmic adaptor subunit [Xanthomonas theicola]|uniref:CusB-like barrel-sandwich hybrid domain-containing protein n=1 Tax=Xanthomonas theicola TaxID=56464 RepID=A0A2S6ZI94_9XANT|nr:efflux RND transporter periplasmic adaptor subunit [Xanthomonas theicola]PPT91975.1 hypothetical protein XthCFBP4691_05865 [Xanthomonas theicola]QNH24958.1 efflux RND transporter periplasmic adaptor subunit [Xanthomonas theicola]